MYRMGRRVVYTVLDKWERLWRYNISLCYSGICPENIFTQPESYASMLLAPWNCYNQCLKTLEWVRVQIYTGVQNTPRLTGLQLQGLPQGETGEWWPMANNSYTSSYDRDSRGRNPLNIQSLYCDEFPWHVSTCSQRLQMFCHNFYMVVQKCQFLLYHQHVDTMFLMSHQIWFAVLDLLDN